MVVATTPILGALVSDVVGASARVEVILPSGADPHDHQPSARDLAKMSGAALLVTNGEGLEEGLRSSLDAARADGVAVFAATEHVELSEGPDGSVDPHIVLDPLRMAAVALALGTALEDGGVAVGDAPTATAARLRELDERITERTARLAPDERRIVTGHRSMGYFADRYDFEVVGTVLPSLSASAQVSAADIASVTEVIEARGAKAIVAEPGTTRGVLAAIADETGVQVVTVHTESFGPGTASYEEHLTGLADALVDGLDGR